MTRESHCFSASRRRPARIAANAILDDFGHQITPAFGLPGMTIGIDLGDRHSDLCATEGQGVFRIVVAGEPILTPLGTDEQKEFLTTAPWLVVVFQLTHTDDGGQVYYLKESVGLACGLFLAAAQFAGLATLTHTPSPMAFLGEILGRPKHERPFLLIPVGYPAAGCMVPQKAIERRPLDEVMVVV